MSFRPDLELSKICDELWEADVNRLRPGKDYQIDLQGRARFGRDRAKDPLFAYVKEEALQRPTFRCFIALLDNYESATGRAEEVTREEVQENRDFIDAICETKVMQLAHRFLVSKGKSKADIGNFKRQLYDMWFKLYRRCGRYGELDSSGFEHVFVGETRCSDGKKEVLGFHNWIQFYMQEKCGNVDYQGYSMKKKPELKDKSHLISIKFQWNEETKPRGSCFVGTSPEFEMALYTICFLIGRDGDTTDEITMGGYDVIITCYKHGRNLGTAYPKEP